MPAEYRNGDGANDENSDRVPQYKSLMQRTEPVGYAYCGDACTRSCLIHSTQEQFILMLTEQCGQFGVLPNKRFGCWDSYRMGHARI